MRQLGDAASTHFSVISSSLLLYTVALFFSMLAALLLSTGGDSASIPPPTRSSTSNLSSPVVRAPRLLSMSRQFFPDVLVRPTRPVPYITDLHREELADLIRIAQCVDASRRPARIQSTRSTTG